MKPKLIKVDDWLAEKLKDPYFKELYELQMQKTNLIKPIIAYRIKHDLTQAELAEKIGITQQHFSKVESGDFASMETLEKVLLFVGYTVKMQAVPLDASLAKRLSRSRIAPSSKTYSPKQWRKIKKLSSAKGRTFTDRNSAKKHLNDL